MHLLSKIIELCVQISQ
uniref:Uncharacterized protein n=1 Tax=Anguilla anguilla TaxID=7936 RepID=A0A0E9V034_ANGAN